MPNVTCKDVDLEAGWLRVNRTLGLGHDANCEPRVEPPKTPKSNRTVRIPEFALGALRDDRTRRRFEERRAGDAWYDYDPVFTTTVGTPLNTGDVLRRFRGLLATGGVRSLRFHDLRHAAASLMIEAGEDLTLVRDVLGHSTISTTANLYVHLAARARDQAARRLNATVMGG